MSADPILLKPRFIESREQADVIVSDISGLFTTTRGSRAEVGWYPTGQLTCPACTQVPLDEHNSVLYASFARELSATAWTDSGIFVLSNMALCPGPIPPPLLVDLSQKRFIAGDKLGWDRSVLLRHASPPFADIDNHAESLTFHCKPEGWSSIEGPVTLLDAPGRAIYGHWLVDYVPRLELLKRLGLLGAVPVIVHPRPWARVFLNALGLDASNEIHLEPKKAYRCDKVLVPGFFRAGQILFTRSIAPTWIELREKLLQNPIPLPNGLTEPPRRIYVSRRKLESASAGFLRNGLRIADFLSRQGFVEIHPQLLSVSQQAWAFSRAEVVVGEDGSALHNTIFAPPGCETFVLLTRGRVNFLHLSIGQALGHRVTYVRGEVSGEGTIIRPQLLHFLFNEAGILDAR